ncbi:tRNA (mnm(5)s(2)U34)-methyltransferase [Calderihabitans maritimus]|uniref:Putative S-adenosylmethionine-dependent methyltransferase involved in cell envelope biogenesis n=1 Tax=Calderihabitans maritimus TaxID=1246530 RepID=A0A1Z5HS08_9FIRM|nr:class I SAM-dependent methyltransferase [Calderihabitans maritimus]GAW92309.1 putative S-adenosylmethionine-dependent methyltransferase involved in cell envelope biogenesis [Calderihabitans maritimus]
MVRIFPNAVVAAQEVVGRVLREGQTAVDATAGNGHDTLFLAKQVGPGGKVYAFDIQQEALDITARRLRSNGIETQVDLIRAGHENMDQYVKEPVQAAMFNLGYLPGGDHRCITRPDSTVRAIGKAMELLQPGGIITIVIYTGHPGGREEAEAVEKMAREIPQEAWDVVRLDFPNRINFPPYLIIIQRRF